MARGPGLYYADSRHTRSATEQLAIGLGWFSIGLGIAEILAPDSLARLIGVRDDERTRKVLRAFGAREIGTGIAILRGGPDAASLWGRVGGDALDLWTMTKALDDPHTDRTRLFSAIGAVAGVTAIDAIAANGLSQTRPEPYRRMARSRERSAVRVKKAFTINRQLDVVYDFWRKLDNLPRFMRHLESVEVLDQRRSRWRAKAPVGTVEWEAEIVDEQPNERISWRSLEGATVPNRGTVRFTTAPGARGTEVEVDLEYSLPGGRLASLVAKMFGEEPEQQIADDLRRVKQLLETGEITRSEGSTSYWQPAQPLSERQRRRIESEVRR